MARRSYSKGRTSAPGGSGRGTGDGADSVFPKIHVPDELKPYLSILCSRECHRRNPEILQRWDRLREKGVPTDDPSNSWRVNINNFS